MKYLAPEERKETSWLSQSGAIYQQDTDILYRFAKKQGWSAGYVLARANDLHSKRVKSPEAIFDID